MPHVSLSLTAVRGTRVLIVTFDEGDILSSRNWIDITMFDRTLFELHPGGSLGIVSESGQVTETITEHQISAGTVADEFTFAQIAALAGRAAVPPVRYPGAANNPGGRVRLGKRASVSGNLCDSRLPRRP